MVTEGLLARCSHRRRHRRRLRHGCLCHCCRHRRRLRFSLPGSDGCALLGCDGGSHLACLDCCRLHSCLQLGPRCLLPLNSCLDHSHLELCICSCLSGLELRSRCCLSGLKLRSRCCFSRRLALGEIAYSRLRHVEPLARVGERIPMCGFSLMGSPELGAHVGELADDSRRGGVMGR